MLEIVVVAVIGTVIAGLWDLFTTEVPDHLAFGLVGVGILYWVADGIATGVYTNFMISAIVGSLLLLFGLVMYRKGQWGGADAWILAGIGYAIPVYGGALFILPYLMNFALVALVYTAVYALVIGVRNPGVFGRFTKDLKKNALLVVIPAACLLAVSVAYIVTSSRIVAPFLFLAAFAVVMVIFWRYAKVIENHVFTRKIPTSKLKKGDVLKEMNWVGLTEAQVARLKSKHGHVTIKDGVRFVPVFPIALVVTLLFGNVFLIIFG